MQLSSAVWSHYPAIMDAHLHRSEDDDDDHNFSDFQKRNLESSFAS